MVAQPKKRSDSDASGLDRDCGCIWCVASSRCGDRGGVRSKDWIGAADTGVSCGW